MRAYLTLVRRELACFLLSPRGNVLLAGVLFIVGVSFAVLLPALRETPSDVPITELFYRTMVFWLILLLLTPVITMRLFAEEKALGTFETLMTAPISDRQVVLAKFTAAWLFYLLTWLPLLLLVMVSRRFTDDPAAVDWRVSAAIFVGIATLGAFYVAIGCWASAMTRSQIIAAMTSFAVGITLFLVSFFSYNVAAPNTWQARVADHISLLEHMQAFARGIVDSRCLVYYTSGTVFFLFLTLKVIESRRWK